VTDANDLGANDYSNVRELIIRGKQVDWTLVRSRFPSLISAYCVQIDVKCVGDISGIQTDCICNAIVITTAKPSPSPTTSKSLNIILLNSLLEQLQRVAPSTATDVDPATMPVGQCPAVYQQGIVTLLSNVPNDECLSVFLGGADGMVLLIFGFLVGGSSTLFTSWIIVLKFYRSIAQVCVLPVLFLFDRSHASYNHNLFYYFL
jgi:hypothetical protein